MSRAARRWRASLAEWAIPEHILERAPESPWGFPTGLFQRSADLARGVDTPSRRRALEVLPEGGSVLDVGAGAGAASLALLPRPGLIVAVDEGPAMLEVFSEGAEKAGVAHMEVLGSWPEVATEVESCDLVVCHHVFYNAPDLASFAWELSELTDHRVVVELTAEHPLSGLNDLWRHFHGLERPSRPTADDAIDVLEEMGFAVGVERWTRASLWAGADPQEFVAFVRRRLCLTPQHDEEIAGLLAEGGRAEAPRNLVTLWWDVRSAA